MQEVHLITTALFLGFFLIGTAVIRIISKKLSVPFTVALLVSGFAAQFLQNALNVDFAISLEPEFIFYFLLPALLFESAMHINFHQFRLQFKTITFLATFGLLMSIFFIGAAVSILLGLPFGVALLFGAIISATDPIAVLSLFKTLGAPKRLSLIADGESMFNDATAVIVFRAISTYVVGNAIFGPTKLLPNIGDIFYVFIGSVLFGALLGYLTSRIIAKMKGERLVITALTGALALGSFAAAEHFFLLSGVITTVIAGITLGNLARSKMQGQVVHFLEEFWEYIGFLSLSLVFFFATFTLDISLFTGELGVLLVVILIVLVARAFSVYLTIFFSNTLSFFKDEPNIPGSWQHVITWGGLRGVIPLVLVYSLPDDFAYKEMLLRFTLATLLFTLFVNGVTIRKLLIALKLHLPKKEETIIDDEMRLFDLGRKRRKLAQLAKREFAESVIQSVDKHFVKQEMARRKHLLSVSTTEEFERSLKLEALNIERRRLNELFNEGRMTEAVYYEFDSELDLQQDALEYPEVFIGRGFYAGGFLRKQTSFRKWLFDFRRKMRTVPMLAELLDVTDDDLLIERYSLLQARLFTSYAVLDYLEDVEVFFTDKAHKQSIAKVRSMQQGYIAQNHAHAKEIEDEYPTLVVEYQKRIIGSLIASS